MVNIVYEDDAIIVCRKPPGLLSEYKTAPACPRSASFPPPAAGSEESFISLVSDYLKDKGHAGYAGLVHRLDRGTGGLILLSKDEKITGKLCAAFSCREASKEYFAVVHGVPAEKSGIYTDLLFKDSALNKSFVVDRPRKGVREASLQYSLIAEAEDKRFGPLSLVRIKLHTGRTHQIRVQFSSRKMPLFRDGKYGSRAGTHNIALFSAKISLIHPKTGKLLEVSALPELEFPWNLYSNVLTN